MAPMIRSLGPTHAQFTTLIENSPPGSEVLILKLLAIVAEKATLSSEIAESVKKLGKERTISPKFYLAIIGNYTKVCL